MKQLKKMLQYTRRHDSEGERLFVKQFIMPLKPTVFKDPVTDEVFAFVVDVADAQGVVPPVLWSSHVDSVHSKDDPVYQTVLFDQTSGLAYKDDKRPLGADDAAGVWVMLQMIKNNIAGSYVFHRGEECGGIGSRGMAAHYKDWLEGFDYAIAFDRRGTDSVITCQGGRTASDAFAQALSDLLGHSKPDAVTLAYAPDPTGLFTDTANYCHLIPECTNLSVGYYNEHTGDEYLDLLHLQALANQMCHVFKDSSVIKQLPVSRKPTSRWTSTMNKYSNVYQLDAPTAIDAETLVGMRFSDVVRYVQTTDAREVADLLMYLADEVVYAQDQQMLYNIEDNYDESTCRNY
jgi:hypothetical protein